MSPITDDCTEEVILDIWKPQHLKNQTTEEILPTDGDHSEEIPTFSDYDSHDEEYEPSIKALSESELIHYHAKEWTDSLSRDDVCVSVYRISCRYTFGVIKVRPSKVESYLEVNTWAD